MPRTEWRHHSPVRLLAGAGVLARIADVVGEGPVLLVTSAGFTRRGTTAQVTAALGAARVAVHDTVSANPELDDIDDAIARLRAQAPATIVALGGGSVIDTAKALSVGLPAPAERPLAAHFRDHTLDAWRDRIPVVAVPTTAGTGAEVTPFATVWDASTHRKFSVAGDFVYPAVALLDPELTLTLPRQETLFPGLDTVSHACESLWSKGRTPVSTALAVEALRLVLASLPVVLARGGDLEARARMQQASALAGIAISQTRTAIAHAISYPLTSHHGVPHGLACSFTLPALIATPAVLAAVPEHARAPLEAVGALLAGLGVRAELARFVSADEVRGHLPEMFTPGRADNAYFAVDEGFVREILDRSL